MQINKIANTIIITSWRRSIYLVNYMKKVQFEYRKFGHISNAKIICVLKLLIRLKDFNANYNLKQIYSNIEVFELKILLLTMLIYYPNKNYI